MPIPQVPAADRLFMCQVALATKIRYVNQILHIRSIRRIPSKVRYSERTHAISHYRTIGLLIKAWFALRHIYGLLRQFQAIERG